MHSRQRLAVGSMPAWRVASPLWLELWLVACYQRCLCSSGVLCCTAHASLLSFSDVRVFSWLWAPSLGPSFLAVHLS